MIISRILNLNELLPRNIYFEAFFIYAINSLLRPLNQQTSRSHYTN